MSLHKTQHIMEAQIGGKTIELTDEGYLTDISQWNKEVAISIAEMEGITLGDDHWKVLDYLQNQYKFFHHFQQQLIQSYLALNQLFYH